jgi:succinate dehydrogenase hydrophobic anchor subunit
MNLSIEEKAIAINLAMNIDQGNVDLNEVVNVFAENFNDAFQIITFWKSLINQSPMIKDVLEQLHEKFTLEMQRNKLEEIYLYS